MAGKRVAGPVSAPNGVFDTADGRLSVLALNNDQFARLCRALDRPQWLADPAYADNARRMARRDPLHAEHAAQLPHTPPDLLSAPPAQHAGAPPRRPGSGTP